MSAKSRRSLRWKLLWPLVLSSLLLVVVIVWVLQGRARRQLVSDLQKRAELVANMISYTAESISRAGELQRIVSAVGADHDVRQILVVVDNPPRVVGSTQARLRNVDLKESQGAEIHAELLRVLNEYEAHSSFNGKEDTYVFIAPMQLAHNAFADGVPVNGAVIIKLDTRSLTEEVRSATIMLSTMFLIGLFAFFGAALLLLQKRVLRPLELLNRHIESAENDAIPDEGIDFGDEVGRLALALNDFRERKDVAMRELANQKFALDQHAIVSIANADGRIMYANDKLCAISGFDREELIGKNHRVLKSGYHTKEFYAYMWNTITSGETWHGEICNRAKNGDIYWVSSSIVPLIGVGGKPEAYIGIRTDITERKHIEEQLQTAKEQADAASQAKSEFLATMSHEIRTPLNGIIGFTDLLRSSDLTNDQRDQVRLLRRSGETLLMLINDILDLSKIESGKLVLESEVVDIHRCLNDALQLFEDQATQKQLKLSLQIDPDVPRKIMGDALRLRQIALKLVGNALKFTSKGEVLVKVSNDDGFILVKVLDTGVGLDEVEKCRLFKKFSQADASTTRRYGGTGLGLVISKNLVEAMNGAIGVQSVKGEGSTFYFSIPIILPDEGLLQEAGNSGGEDSSSDEDGPKAEGTVLVVDDNNVNLLVVKTMLQALGYEARMAVDGREAVEVASKEPFKAILMDFHMPVLDGIDATKEIRSGDGPNKHSPIIAVSASLEDCELCVESGMDRFLAKPFRKADLRKMLREAISARA